VKEEQRRRVNDRHARQWFRRIERDGWTCTNCGRQHFRLSIGPKPCVICTKCGWVQDRPEEVRRDIPPEVSPPGH
jgi:hypothetical protein